MTVARTTTLTVNSQLLRIITVTLCKTYDPGAGEMNLNGLFQHKQGPTRIQADLAALGSGTRPPKLIFPAAE
jgi:hypothetical protein